MSILIKYELFNKDKKINFSYESIDTIDESNDFLDDVVTESKISLQKRIEKSIKKSYNWYKVYAKYKGDCIRVYLNGEFKEEKLL